MSWWLKSSHPWCPLICLSFFSSFPCLHPTPKEKNRRCFSWLPAFPTHAWHHWGLTPALPHPRLPNLSAAFLLPLGRCGLGGWKEGNPKCRGSAGHGFSSASCQGRARSCWCEGGTAPCRQSFLDCVWQSKLFQWQRAGAFWVGSDAESCSEIRDEQLTLINTFYCQTSHKPHNSLWRFIAALMTLFYYGDTEWEWMNFPKTKLE